MIQLVHSGTLAGMRGVTVAQDDVISSTPLSRLGGDKSQCSDWLLITLHVFSRCGTPLVHRYCVFGGWRSACLPTREVYVSSAGVHGGSRR